MRRLPLLILAVLLGAALLLVTLWAALALWYRLPGPAPLRGLAAGGFGLFGLVVALAVARGRGGRSLAVFAAAFAGILVWWSTITPPAEANWAPEVARQVTGRVEGDILTLTNVREFDWHGPDSYTENWTTRRYDLATLQSADLFLSYWAGPQMAHVMLSFGFADGTQLPWSIEVRRTVDGAYAPLADAFKQDGIVMLASVEQDVVGVRAVHRGEDVQIYRLALPPEALRALLLEYVADANALAETPRFYNSITTNCTTTITRMNHAVGQGGRFDWRLIANGYLPDLGYDRGVIDTSVPLDELRRLAKIDARARANGLNDGFSAAIRAGVPSPLDGAG